MKVFAIDPGPHTGVYWGDGNCTLDLTEVVNPHLTLWAWLDHWIDSTMTVVVEDFEFRKEERSYVNYEAAQYLGVVQLYCQKYTIPYTVQKAAAGKGFWIDDKLKRVGLYKGCDTRHSRDALRHWLHYRTFYLDEQDWLEKLK